MTVINPIDNEPMRKKSAQLVLKAREARRGAKKAARSGNPAKRFPAFAALKEIPEFIRRVYTAEYDARIKGVPES